MVFGIVRAGKPVDILVQKSYPLLTYTDTLDKNILTDISLSVNDELKETLYRQNNHYFSKYIPQSGDKIKISFEWQGKEISTEGEIPKSIQIDSVQYLSNDSEGKNFNLFFKDDFEEHNYYDVSVSIRYKNDSLGVLTDFYFVTSKSPLIGNEEDLSDYYDYQSLLFSDTLFNGRNVKLLIKVSALYLSYDEELINVNLHLSKIDKDYYMYVKSFLKNQAAQTPGIFNGNTEYINVHSNIKNGYGIVKFFSIDTKDITTYYK